MPYVQNERSERSRRTSEEETYTYVRPRADDSSSGAGAVLFIIGFLFLCFLLCLFAVVAIGFVAVLAQSAAQDRRVEDADSPKVLSSASPRQERERSETESPPTYYDDVLVVRPTRTSASPSTRGTTNHSGVVWCIFYLLGLLEAIWLCKALYGFVQPTTPAQSVVDINVPEAAIAVMGATGSGKSSFINIVSGSNLAVCEGLRPCTDTVQAVDAFDLDGRQVVLIDTPGFDDTTLSDTEVLSMITAFLATSYERGTTLAGVLYFHRISDPRMTRISWKNFGMFRMLCGNSTLQNVVIVTNMWGEVSLQVGDALEAELAQEDLSFKPALENGAQMARHDNTTSSAENIIRLILDNRPLPLRIHEELVAEGKDIPETSADEQTQSESKQGAGCAATKHQQQIKELQNEKAQLLEQIKHRDGFFSKIGEYLDRIFS